MTETITAGHYPIATLPYGEWWGLNDLHAWDLNPPQRSKRDPDYLRLLASLAAEGQADPAIINLEARVLVDGNRRLRAIQELGWSHLWVVAMKPGASIAATVRAINATQRRWGDGEHATLARTLPDYGKYLSKTQVHYIKSAYDALGDAGVAFFHRYSTRAVRLARRVANVTGLELAVVLRYLMAQEDGVVRALERALSLDINPERLAEIISTGEPLKPRW